MQGSEIVVFRKWQDAEAREAALAAQLKAVVSRSVLVRVDDLLIE